MSFARPWLASSKNERSKMTDLIKYDAACRAVAEAANIDEAKDLRDKGEAMRAYAKQAKNKQLEVQAAEIRIRAERRIGELMAAQRDAGEMAKGGQPHQSTGLQKNPVAAAPTLAEAGIDKNLADRARKYAAIPEPEFNGIVSDWRGRVEAENERVTVNLLAAGSKAEEQPEVAADAPDAKDRRALAKLTTEALIDEVIGLRADLADTKAKFRAQKVEIEALKENVKDLSSSDTGSVIAVLKKRLGHAENEKWRQTEETGRVMKQVYALKKRVAELESEISNQVVTL